VTIDSALVCGGSGALGAAVVRAFLGRGDHVVSVDRQLPLPGTLLPTAWTAIRTSAARSTTR
jgi:NAD(P)-dependent dehydrogenase (short-subunit alcohol dehydrogenase family)